jgi:threonylcarbamoyladenosine tRNA methylthiotransferase MtaB
VKKEFGDHADVRVETCSVTENADKECRQIVRRIQRKAPESLVIITGCYAQLKPEEIASIPGVDLVLGCSREIQHRRTIREISKGDSANLQLRYRRSEWFPFLLFTPGSRITF